MSQNVMQWRKLFFAYRYFHKLSKLFLILVYPARRGTKNVVSLDYTNINIEKYSLRISLAHPRLSNK